MVVNMGAILKLKKIWRPQREKIYSFKYHHFLNTLPQARLKEILLFSESDQIEKTLPSLADKRTLCFDDGAHKYLLKKILKKSPPHLLQYYFGGADPDPTQVAGFMIMGGLGRLAVRKDYFDLVICPFSQETRKVNDEILVKICQTIKNGGRLVLSLMHPQLEHLLFNQNPAETQSSNSTVSQYFKILKEHEVYTEEITEGMVDATLKPFFATEDEVDYYQEYKHTPLTLLFKAVKFSKKR